LDAKGNDKIDKIFDFAINMFKRQIDLAEAAGIGNMSVRKLFPNWPIDNILLTGILVS